MTSGSENTAAVVSRDAAVVGAVQGGGSSSPAGRPKESFLPALARTSGRFGTIAALIILCVVFTVANDQFLTKDNLLGILNASALNAILATGLTMTLVLFDFDLSVVYTANLAGMYFAGESRDYGVATGLWVALLIGLIVGLVNGIIITYFRISAFIATLGVGLILQGVIFGYSGNAQITDDLPDNFTTLGIGELFGVRYLVWIMLIVMIIMWAVLSHTPLGRQMYAIGGNPVAARLAGIRVRRVRIIAFTICGIIAAVGGILLASNLDAGNPTAASGYMFNSFTAAFIGAATLRDGQFHIFGTLVGALILGVLANGLVLVGVGPGWQTAVQGIVLVAAVAISGLLRRRSSIE